jgi:amidase
MLVKDSIATGDIMQTTAGSLALLHIVEYGDELLVGKLRAAGAVILGKANLSEWANFRGFVPRSIAGVHTRWLHEESI